MKKSVGIQIIVSLLVVILVGCGVNSPTSNDDIADNFTSSIESSLESSETLVSIDYSDAKSFEEALNNGKKVAGKIVQFDVLNYNPKSYIPWLPFVNWDMGQEKK